MTDQPASFGASLKKSLRGNTPVYIIQKSHQFNSRLGEVFETLHDDHGSKLGLGLSVKLAAFKPQQLGDFFNEHSAVPMRIADPELHRHPSSGWEGIERIKPRATPLPWNFYSVLHQKPNAAWIREVIQSQVNYGATVALSATGWVDAAKATRSLTDAMSVVAASREIVGPEKPMFVNLTFDSRWLTDKELRGILLQEIVESSEKHWYLRFWWPLITYRYGQLLDVEVLRGYRLLARTAALEGKRLYLPNSGLTGWLMTAFGATGFSTGSAWPDQAFGRERIMGGRKGQKPPPHTPRLFDRSILHTIDYAIFERLAAIPSHKEFPTSFSRSIAAAEHSKELAALHYLVSVGHLQAKLGGNRQMEAAKAVHRGTGWLNSLDPLDRPSGGAYPAHLSIWRDLLN